MAVTFKLNNPSSEKLIISVVGLWTIAATLLHLSVQSLDQLRVTVLLQSFGYVYFFHRLYVCNLCSEHRKWLVISGYCFLLTHLFWFFIDYLKWPVSPLFPELVQLLGIIAAFAFFYLESWMYEKDVGVRGFVADLLSIFLSLWLFFIVANWQSLMQLVQTTDIAASLKFLNFVTTTIFTGAALITIVSRICPLPHSYHYLLMGGLVSAHIFSLSVPLFFTQAAESLWILKLGYICLAFCCLSICSFLLRPRLSISVYDIRFSIVQYLQVISIGCLILSIPAAITINFYLERPSPSSTIITMFSFICMLVMLIRLLGHYFAEAESRRNYFSESHFDQLTGLTNRRGLKYYMESNQVQEIAIICIDLNDFKSINDEYGHLAGDRLLVHVSAKLTELMLKDLSESDFCICRMGGDEFIILVRNPNVSLSKLGKTLYQQLQGWFTFNQQKIYFSSSLGISNWYQNSALEAVFRAADLAMYEAKRKSLGILHENQVDQSIAGTRQKRRELLQSALQSKDLTLYAQPLFLLDSGKLSGFELLARIKMDNGEILLPEDFLDIVDEGGMERPFTEAVIAVIARNANLFKDIQLSINVPPKLLTTAPTANWIDNRIKASGLTPQQITIELVETDIDLTQILPCINRLKALGYSIALDDFGTGFSNLSRLGQIPFDVIKIDKSLVALASIGDTSLIVSATELAHSRGLKVVAEGVETEFQLSCVKRLGIDYVQGYYTGHPIDIRVTSDVPGYFPSLLLAKFEPSSKINE